MLGQAQALTQAARLAGWRLPTLVQAGLPSCNTVKLIDVAVGERTRSRAGTTQ